jgi:hypothetical protein
MTIQAFHKALAQVPLSQAERAALTGDELFVLVATRRIETLTAEEQRRMAPDDLRLLVAEGVIGGSRMPPAAGRSQGPGWA